MSSPSKRTPLKGSRRIPLTVTVDAETHASLHWIGEGNRSRAIEALVREHLDKLRAHSPDLVPDFTSAR